MIEYFKTHIGFVHLNHNKPWSRFWMSNRLTGDFPLWGRIDLYAIIKDQKTLILVNAMLSMRDAAGLAIHRMV